MPRHLDLIQRNIVDGCSNIFAGNMADDCVQFLAENECQDAKSTKYCKANRVRRHG